MGGTSIKYSVYDEELRLLFHRRIPIAPMRSEGGRIEYDSALLFSLIAEGARELRERGARLLGISTMRASVLAWSREGEPITGLISWQDRRAEEIASGALYRLLRFLPPFEKVLRPESPSAKIKWMLDRIPALREKVWEGKAFIGTFSSFIAYKISGRYLNDATNEALTGLLHPHSLERLLPVYEILRIPRQIDPEIVDNIHHIGSIGGLEVVSMIADQQAALIGASCLSTSCAKVTAGTGIFVDAPVQDFFIPPKGLLPILVYKVGKRKEYAIEAFGPGTSSFIDWLVRSGVLESPERVDEMSRRASRSALVATSASGLLINPAEVWSREDLVRGAVEGAALLTASLLSQVESACERREVVKVDGGLSRSVTYSALLATLVGRRIERVKDFYATGRGVAALLATYDGKMKIEELGGMNTAEDYIEPGKERMMGA